MADMAGQILSPATIGVGKWVAASIKRQFIIYCCFNSNLRSLRDEAKKLDVARATLQLQVDEATSNARVTAPQVDDWFEKTNQILDEKQRIELRIPDVQKGCLSIISRIPLAKKAKMTAESMKELRDGCQFDPLSLPPPPQSTKVPKLTEPTYAFESRKDIEECVMNALRDGKVNLVGICGMGGIGKTNMANNLRKRVMDEKLFDESVMVTVSQTVNIFGIQTKMAEQLGIQNFKDLESREARANKLGERLSGTRRILLVVDDIWEELKLEEDLGISCGNDSKSCTVLLTSRTEDVLKRMDVMVFGMDILSESESWSLFRETAGSCVDDQSLAKIAKEVAGECNGLPIAIVTIGSALKRQKLHAWEDALDRLKNRNMQPDVKKKLYVRLRLSYDFLDDQEEKSLFLLCGLFPEDFEINLDQLAWCSMELKIIGGISNTVVGRKRVLTIADKLKSRFLLLEGSDEDRVKMHDVIGDMAIYIAREISLVDDQSGTTGHLDMDSKGVLRPGGSDQSLDLLMAGSKSSTYIELQSRKWLEDAIIQVIRDENINLIGIIGMGGIGKTTMATKLRQRGMEENLFDETVMIVVGSEINMLKIQLEIAEWLGCEEYLRNLDTLQERANKLSSILGGRRRILIVLDDIWESIELGDLGIPCGKDSKGCTVLLTSRNMSAMEEMNAKVCPMHPLSRSEGWALFKEAAGACVDNESLVKIAREVANWCGGLPIYILTVGRALKDQKMSIWQDALDQIKSSKGDFQRFELHERSIWPLGLCYKYLRDPEEKSVFILCSLFPWGSNINMEDLALYSLVFNIFGGINNLEQATKRLVTIVKKLKNRFLLSDGDRQNHVKMHDMINGRCRPPDRYDQWRMQTPRD